MRTPNPVERACEAIYAPVRWVHGWAFVFVAWMMVILYLDRTFLADEWIFPILSLITLLHMHVRHDIGWSRVGQAAFRFRMDGDLALQSTAPFLLVMVAHLAAISFGTPKPGLIVSVSLMALSVLLLLEDIIFIAPASALYWLWRLFLERWPR